MNSRDKTTFILALIFALVTAAVFVGSLFYVIHKGQSLIESHALILEYQNKEDNYNQIQKILNESKNDRDLMRTFFLENNERQTLVFVNNLERLARKLGVEVRTDSLAITGEAKAKGAALTTKKDYKYLNLNLVITGQKKEVTEYLSLLDNLPYDSVVTQISLRQNEESGLWKGEVGLKITLLP